MTKSIDRIRDTALHHANLLQQRKDAEALILSSIEKLLDLPFSTTDPAHPSEYDTVNARKLLKSFQPSDYDSLIEERNINRNCGYVLCPHPNKLEDTKAKCRILRDNTQGKHELKFVEKQAMERWCSDECGKRALYIRVQLSDEPAWTRMAGTGGEILFLDEGNDNHGLIEGLEKLRVGAETKEEIILAAMKDLSIERGDMNFQGSFSGLPEVKILENVGSEVPSERGSNLIGSYDLPESIEGYTSRFKNGKLIREDTKNGLDGREDVMHTV